MQASDPAGLPQANPADAPAGAASPAASDAAGTNSSDAPRADQQRGAGDPAGSPTAGTGAAGRTRRFKVLSRLKRNGRVIEAGGTVDLPEEEFGLLKAAGVVAGDW